MDLGERYLELVLRLRRLVPELVESYVGPAELAIAVDAEPPPSRRRAPGRGYVELGVFVYPSPQALLFEGIACLALEALLGDEAEDVDAYARRWMLEDDQFVARSLEGLKARVWRPCESCYPASLELCRRHTAGEPIRFKELLNRQLTPGRLR